MARIAQRLKVIPVVERTARCYRFDVIDHRGRFYPAALAALPAQRFGLQHLRPECQPCFAVIPGIVSVCRTFRRCFALPVAWCYPCPAFCIWFIHFVCRYYEANLLDVVYRFPLFSLYTRKTFLRTKELRKNLGTSSKPNGSAGMV